MSQQDETRVVWRMCEPGTASDNVVLDEEFEALIPPLAPGDLDRLHQSLEHGGCTEALVLWRDHGSILVDGHKRLRLCRKLGWAFPVIEMEFRDRDEVRRWILDAQALRCDLSPLAASCVRGKRYLEADKHPGARRDLTSANSEQRLGTCANNEQRSAAERLSEEFGSGRSTIRRDALISEAFEKIVANCGRETRQLFLARTSGVTQVCVLELARQSVAEQKKFVEQLRKNGGKLVRERRARGQRPARITLTLEPDAIVQGLLKYLEPDELAEVAGSLVPVGKNV